MSTPEELRDEAREERYRRRRGTIDVEGRVDCEEFRVPSMPGLDFSAEYEWSGYVTPDHSGDHITPDGPPSTEAALGSVISCTISIDGAFLPDWLEEHLSETFGLEIASAFLAAIGGEEKLREIAVDKAFG
jgi:hypothetical protein